MSMTTLALTLVYFVAKKNLKMIELAGSSLAGTGCFLVVGNYYLSVFEMDFMMNNQELCWISLLYFAYVGLLTT